MDGMIKLRISSSADSDHKDNWYVSCVILCSVVQGITGSFSLRIVCISVLVVVADGWIFDFKFMLFKLTTNVMEKARS